MHAVRSMANVHDGKAGDGEGGKPPVVLSELLSKGEVLGALAAL